MIRLNFFIFLLSRLFSMDTSSISFHEIEFELVRNSYSDITYIHLHGDEKTAKMLLSEHITQKSGRAFFIKSNAREVELGPTMVDPNRLFSRYGSMKALRKFKPNWKPEKLNQLLDELDRARKLFLVNIFPSKGGIIVALHNNFRGYNVHSELYKSQSNSIKKGQNPRDFIICTDAKDYQILKNGPYNVVLQNKILLLKNYYLRT